jgi:peptidoglycan/xylan/chitin deacetylase (PgdA/CDA1 family)
MRNAVAASCLLAALCVAAPVKADDCAVPGALGVSRTIAVDPAEHPLVGGLQYRESLPLNDHEVVLTFDDGPLQPYTNRVLDALAAECVKATFFIVGRMARGYPNMVRRTYAEGHTIANHSQHHPFTFHKMTVDSAAREIEDGFASTREILGDPAAVADFFRVPGLLRQDSVEQYLRERRVSAWSLDFLADDWTHISDKEIVRRAVNRIEAKGRGILLLHDIQPATAAALPVLLRELKVRGYKIVHVVQAGPDHPKTETTPEQWAWAHGGEIHNYWPPVQVASLNLPDPVLGAPNPKNFGIVDSVNTGTTADFKRSPQRSLDGGAPLAPIALWPRSLRLVAMESAEELPAPAVETFRYSRIGRPSAYAGSKAAQRRDTASEQGGTGTHAVRPMHAVAAAARSSGPVRFGNVPPMPPRPIPQQFRGGHQI